MTSRGHAKGLYLQPRKQPEISHVARQECITMMDCPVAAINASCAPVVTFFDNAALHQAMTGEQIEATLRRVIREGLRA